jgi:hypothetical protein
MQLLSSLDQARWSCLGRCAAVLVVVHESGDLPLNRAGLQRVTPRAGHVEQLLPQFGRKRVGRRAALAWPRRAFSCLL